MNMNFDPIVNGLEPVVSKFNPNGFLIATSVVVVTAIGATCYCNRNATRQGQSFKSKLLGIESAPAQQVRVIR